MRVGVGLQVGVGRFQWAALLVCGLANAADAVEILGLSLVLPAAEDDLALTAAGKSALSSCIFAGELSWTMYCRSEQLHMFPGGCMAGLSI